ncbi:MAG: hypothetical protein WA695_01195 [Candidatus Dormiibacterota bacterium]
MSLYLLDAPQGGRDLSDPRLLGEYPDEPSALEAVRQHGEVDPNCLVLARWGGVWVTIAEGKYLAAWAQLDRRPAAGIPRVRRDKTGQQLLCGWCGGSVALLTRGRIYPVEALVRAGLDRQRNSLPTWLVRGTALRSKSRPTVDLLRDRQQRQLARAPGTVANYINDDSPVALLECPRCAPKLGKAATSLLVRRLDTGGAQP